MSLITHAAADPCKRHHPELESDDSDFAYVKPAHLLFQIFVT